MQREQSVLGQIVLDADDERSCEFPGATGDFGSPEPPIESTFDAAVEAPVEPRDAALAVARVNGIVTGRLVGLTKAGQALVEHDHDSAGRPLLARSTVPLSRDSVGCDVVVAFDQGDLRRPIVLGCIIDDKDEAPPTSRDPAPATAATWRTELDGERLVISAEREIVLRCGKSSITLTRAGKVLIRGAYLSSRSSGVNRIKGGSVQIN